LCLQTVIRRAAAGAPIGERVTKERPRTTDIGWNGVVRGGGRLIGVAKFVQLFAGRACVGYFPDRAPAEVARYAEVPGLHEGIEEAGIERKQRRGGRLG